MCTDQQAVRMGMTSVDLLRSYATCLLTEHEGCVRAEGQTLCHMLKAASIHFVSPVLMVTVKGIGLIAREFKVSRQLLWPSANR